MDIQLRKQTLKKLLYWGVYHEKAMLFGTVLILNFSDCWLDRTVQNDTV
jgi:hypothetical protein